MCMGLATCRKTQAKQVMPVRDRLKSDRRTRGNAIPEPKGDGIEAPGLEPRSLSIGQMITSKGVC